MWPISSSSTSAPSCHPDQVSDTAETAAAPVQPSGSWAAAAHRSWRIARRIGLGAREPANWVELFKFGAVGASGYVVNLIVFAILVEGLGAHHFPAAIGAFCVAIANNFLWNRHWTFDAAGGHAGEQAWRFLTVSVLGLGINLVGPLPARRRGRPGRAPGPGAGRRDRDAGQLRRQQAVDVQSKLITPVTSSSTSVTPAESSSEPQQPSPLEKKTNMATLLPSPEAR